MRTVEQSINLRKNLKYLRMRNGLTLAAFSKLIDIPKGTYSVFESYGEGIGSERLKKIYDFYQIDETTALMDHYEFIKKLEA